MGDTISNAHIALHPEVAVRGTIRQAGSIRMTVLSGPGGKERHFIFPVQPGDPLAQAGQQAGASYIEPLKELGPWVQPLVEADHGLEH